MAEIYKCLNPVGIQDPVDLFPLAPRLDTLDGKTIYMSINDGGDQDITIPLQREIPKAYPNINWKIKKTFGFSAKLSDEEMRTCDALIAGVVW